MYCVYCYSSGGTCVLHNAWWGRYIFTGFSPIQPTGSVSNSREADLMTQEWADNHSLKNIDPGDH